MIAGLAVFLIVVIFISKSIFEEYRMTKAEIRGIESIKNLLPVLIAFQNYRGIEQIRLNGMQKWEDKNDVEISGKRTIVVSEINGYLDKNKDNQFNINGDLKIISEQLQKHKTTDFHSTLEHFKYHSMQIESIISMIQKIYHSSSLVIDSKYDSYYLETISVLRMTTILENLAQVRGLSSAYVQQRGYFEREYHHLIERGLTLLSNDIESTRLRIGYITPKHQINGMPLNDLMEKALKQADEYSLFTVNLLKEQKQQMPVTDLFNRGTVVIDQINQLQIKIFDLTIAIIKERAREIIFRFIILSTLVLIVLGTLLWGIRFIVFQNRRNSGILQAITHGHRQLIYAENAAEIYLNLCKILVEHGRFIAVGVFLMHHNESKDLLPVATWGKASEYLKNLKVSWGENEISKGPFGLSVKTGKPQIFNNIINEPEFKPWKEFALKYKIHSSAAIPLVYQHQKIGSIGLYSDKKNYFSSNEIELIKNLMEDTMFNISVLETRKERDIALDELHSHNVILKKKVLERTKTIVETQDATILSLASLVESRDNETGNHILRTKEYVRLLLNKLKDMPDFSEELTFEKVDQIYKSSPLHDIGKIAISDNILRKPGKLTENEFEVMKKHTIIGGAAIDKATRGITSTGFLDTAKEIILHHHEKWDGSGYPIGLQGTNIPISARIMTVADVYDALISERVYKKAFTHKEAVAVIEDGIGKHFDPQIAGVFLEIADEFEQVARKYAD